MEMEMDFSWPENLLSSNRKRAIEELSRGREFANHLGSMLSKRLINDGSVSVEDLSIKIFRSFGQTLSILNASEYADEVSQVPATGQDGRMYEEDSGSGSINKSTSTSTSQRRRGLYKRRRKTWETMTKTSSTTHVEDGHAWRKYGQKIIHNAKHPRNYYRCTYKYEQGCQAIKQVQRADADGDDNQQMYRTTYHGHHTCTTNLPISPHFIIDDSTTDDHMHPSSILLSFESNSTKLPQGQAGHLLFPGIKQEEYYSAVSTMNHHRDQYSSYPTALGMRGAMSTVMSEGGAGMSSDSGIYSCTESTTTSRSFENMTMMGCEDHFDYDDDGDAFRFGF